MAIDTVLRRVTGQSFAQQQTAPRPRSWAVLALSSFTEVPTPPKPQLFESCRPQAHRYLRPVPAGAARDLQHIVGGREM